MDASLEAPFFFKKIPDDYPVARKISEQLDDYQEEIITSLIRAELGRRSGMVNKGRARSGNDSDAHVDALWEALQDGGDPADLRQGDGIHRQGPDRDRAAECGITTDLPRLLHTGGQLEDPANDLY